MASSGRKSQIPRSGTGTDRDPTNQTGPTEIGGRPAGVQAQLVQLTQMKRPLLAVKRSTQLSGYDGDITNLYRAYR